MSATASPPVSGGFAKASEIAKFYTVTTATIYKWERDGKIPGVRFQGTVRFNLEAVRAKIEGGAK
jgi:excisionase family DNA binding protein